ncbi:hypothetical protein INR49_015846 [Caranx melampygus]|nr:hypothetical protein INR49_015846 [Caranx melampygus]
MHPVAVLVRLEWLIPEDGWARFWEPMTAWVGRAECVIPAAADPAAPPLDTAAIFSPLCGNNKQPCAARIAGTPPPCVILRGTLLRSALSRLDQQLSTIGSFPECQTPKLPENYWVHNSATLELNADNKTWSCF